MRRREFITLLGGAAAHGRSWRARSSRAMRRIGVLMNVAADDPEAQAHLAAFLQGLAGIGLDRWPQRADRYSLGRGRCRPTADMRRNWSRLRRMSFWPPARSRGIVATGNPHRADRVRDRSPIRSVRGFVASLARPGGNATGFTSVRIQHEREMAGTAQGDRAERDARGGPSRSHPNLPGSANLVRSRPWRRRSG